MDSKTKDILERFAQRLIDNNARSRTYFLGQIKSTDTIDLYSFGSCFSPSLNLGNAILKKNNITFPYNTITPTKINEILDNKEIKKDKELSKLIFGISEKDLNSLLNEKTTDIVSICDKYNNQNRNRYLQIDTLFQSVKQIEKESAKSELFIGYPFIEGTFFSGKVFRAPLLLHEVELQITPNLKTIKFTNEVYINPVFMISYGIENKMPHQRFDFDLDKNILEATTKYLKNKLSLEVNLSKITKIVPFNSCTKNVYEEKFKLYPNEFKISNNAVLGIFQISSKSIYYDIKAICEENEINSLLKKFLSKKQKDTDANDFFNQDDTETSDDKILTTCAADITQKHIIKESIDRNLVIQGPPGTGKSQTIVNIIASNVARGKTILVVSEKKTAIDVIYNRLDKISKFAVILRNITTDKTNFYKQINETLENVKLIDVNEKKSVSSKNKVINRFFNYIHKYSELLLKNFDGFSFSEIASFQNVNVEKNVYLKLKSLITNYDSFKETIDKFFSSDYFETFNKLKQELIDFKTYSLFHYDLKKIEKAKIILTLDISKRAKKYLINRLYYNLPINNYNIPIKVLLKGIKLNNTINTIYQVLEEEIIKLNLDLFNEKESLFADFILLEFLSENPFSREEILEVYKKILYDDVVKENTDVVKFIDRYLNEEDNVTEAMREKEKLSVDNTLIKIATKILKDSNTNKETFESIKELERLSNLQRKKSIPFVVSKLFTSLISIYPIWLLTPEVASSILPVSKDLFDLVVFDEASQIFIENATGVLFRAKRAIVVGDTKQLRPFNIFQSRYVEDEFILDSKKMNKKNVAALEEESLLDYASFKYPQRILRYHYRSEHKNLIEFSNASFYENKLFFASSQTTDDKPLEVINVSSGLWKDNVNIAEAYRVVSKLVEIIKNKKEDESIGIITFNEQQRKLINDLIIKEASINESEKTRILIQKELNRIDEETLEDSSLFVKNIENVQGDERDIIIFSITYARNENGQLNSNFGLLSMPNGENRLNVAITRAKRKIVIVKSFRSSELNINEYNKGPFYFKKYLEYCEYVESNSIKEKEMLLNSMHQDIEEDYHNTFDLLREDLKQKLLKKLDLKKYRIEENYKAGTFFIDLAIFEGNNYLLGIKTDSSLKTNKSFDQENDYYCDKYLLSRGLRIYRVFTCSYFKNPKYDLKRIQEELML